MLPCLSEEQLFVLCLMWYTGIPKTVQGNFLLDFYSVWKYTADIKGNKVNVYNRVNVCKRVNICSLD